MKRRSNTSYDLQEDLGSRDNEEDISFSVSRFLRRYEIGAWDRQSGGDGTAEPPCAVRPNQKMVVRKKVSVQLTAFLCTKSANPANAVSQEMKKMNNRSARGNMLGDAITPVKLSTPVKAFTAPKANFPMKTDTTVELGRSAMNKGAIQPGTNGKVSIAAKDMITFVEEAISANLTTVCEAEV